MRNFYVAPETVVREARGRTVDGLITPEKTLARQAAYDALCAEHPEGIVRLAKFLCANNMHFASSSGDGIVFDPSGNLERYILEAKQLLSVFNGEPISAPFAVREIRWIPAVEKSEVPA